jgi:glycosyltransferase involved in cell wall biosynthesis
MTVRLRSPEHYPSIDVVFPFSDMWLMPYLRHAAAAIQGQDYPAELIKVYISHYHDPANREPITELAEFCREIRAVLVMNPWKDPAFSRGQAFNAGIRCGHGEVVACLDADVVVHRLTFDKLRPFLNRGQSAVICVGRTELRPEEFEPLEDAAWAALAENLDHCRNGLGNILVRRSIMEWMHGYDERYYGWGGGDTELYMRLNHHGEIIYSYDDEVCPKALHLWHPMTTTKNTDFTDRNRNMLAQDKANERWVKEEAVVQNRNNVWGHVHPSREGR